MKHKHTNSLRIILYHSYFTIATCFNIDAPPSKQRAAVFVVPEMSRVSMYLVCYLRTKD